MPNVSEMIANFKGGVRPNKFEVYIDNLPEKMKFLCKASNFPGVTIDPIETYYQNLVIPIAGDSTYPDWTTSVVLDEDYAGRTELEDWMQRINPKGETESAESMSEYFATATITQFGQKGEVLARYKFYNLWPTDLGTIEASFESRSTVSQFDVTWKYSHWEKL